jgi:hypothetical protein
MHACILKRSPLRKNEEKHAQCAAKMADRDASMLRTGELLAILRQRGVPVLSSAKSSWRW